MVVPILVIKDFPHLVILPIVNLKLRLQFTKALPRLCLGHCFNLEAHLCLSSRILQDNSVQKVKFGRSGIIL